MLSFLNAMLGETPHSHAELDDRLLRAAMDAAPVGIVVTDATREEHPAVYVNPYFCAITGYSAGEILGRNLRLLQGPDTDPEAKAALSRGISENRPVGVQLLNYRKGGQPFWMRVEVSPVCDHSGTVVRHIGILSDVSDAHRADEILREREERLRAIRDAIPLPMAIVDGEGRIVEANAHAKACIGTEALHGRRLGQFLDVDQWLDDARGHGGVHKLEIHMRTAAGKERWVLASAVTVHMGEGHMGDGEATIVVFVDITDQKRKEEELSRAKDDAERAIRAKSRFFAAASHDLRQPLQALALFTTALEMHVATPAAQNILSSIKMSLSTMEDMFDSLLDMSRLDAGVLVAAPEVFMVNDVLERLEVEFTPQAAAKSLQLRVVASSAAVRSDPALLDRIVRNFLSNAVRYTQKGKILMGCKRRGGNLRITVADTGPGIPEDLRLAIFEEFFQGSASQTSSGLGLGLAIVQRLARLLSHRLDVRSQPGCGAMFSVDVPLADTPVPSFDEEEDEAALGDLSGRTVMVIDDDPAVCEGLVMLLADWGCRVVAAASGAEAVAAMRRGEGEPDVILADLRLPEEGGGVKAIDGVLDVLGRDVPSFLFTGDTDMTRVTDEHGRRFPILHKPLNPLRLRAVLAEAMNGAPAP